MMSSVPPAKRLGCERWCRNSGVDSVSNIWTAHLASPNRAAPIRCAQAHDPTVLCANSGRRAARVDDQPRMGHDVAVIDRAMAGDDHRGVVPFERAVRQRLRFEPQLLAAEYVPADAK